MRGPYCEGWPIYHAVHDADSGTIYAAAASEWHGAGVWRSHDLGESWELSSEGLGYGDESELKLSKISGLNVAHGRLLAGGEASGIFESRDGGVTWSLITTLDGQPGRGDWNDPAKQPPGHLGLPGLLPHPDDPTASGRSCRATASSRPPTTARPGLPATAGLRADWPLENPEVGYCVHKLVMAPTDHDRLYQQNHCGMHRSDDAGRTWSEITEGLPCDFGFAAAAHPHDRDSFYVIPLDPGHARCMPDGARRSGARATPARAGSGSSTACRSGDAHLGVLREGMAIDAHDVPGLYFGTTTGQVFASADEGESLERDRELPAGDRIGRSRDLRVDDGERPPPHDAAPVFPGLPRELERRGRDGRRGDRHASRSAGRVCATGSASRGRACAGTSTSTSMDPAPTSTRSSSREAAST